MLVQVGLRNRKMPLAEKWALMEKLKTAMGLRSQRKRLPGERRRSMGYYKKARPVQEAEDEAASSVPQMLVDLFDQHKANLHKALTTAFEVSALETLPSRPNAAL